LAYTTFIPEPWAAEALWVTPDLPDCESVPISAMLGLLMPFAASSAFSSSKVLP
jgi:hypothetical protein